MNVGSLFAGIGGFDLGLERAGMRTIWQVEIDPFCRRVLERHFPDAERYEDVREVGAHNLADVDLICGGFPCQDISLAGCGAGIDGERSGLWGEMWRVVCELEPRWVVVENVPALTSRGLDRVLRDLAEGGYDAEWDCISAAAIGAPHRRERIWIVAYPDSAGRSERWWSRSVQAQQFAAERSGEVADPNGQGSTHLRQGKAREAVGSGAERRPSKGASDCTLAGWTPGEQWAVEPDVGRVAHGVPARVDRLRGLGNALVPQIAEWIGRRVMAHG